MSSAATTLPAHSATADPVSAVSVISTGSVEIHPEHALGTSKPLYWWLLTSRRWLPPRPIDVYVIEHAKGLLLFDTGQGPGFGDRRRVLPRRVPRDRLRPPGPVPDRRDDTLDAQLATLGYSPTEVDTAIVSHLHQDHIGGIPQLSNADLLVTAAEWAQRTGFSPEARGFLREHIDIPGARWRHVSFDPNLNHEKINNTLKDRWRGPPE